MKKRVVRKQESELHNMTMQFMVSQVTCRAKPVSTAAWATVQGSFRNQDVTPHELLDLISAGYSFTARHVPEEKRKENWQSAHYVCMDLEKHEKAALEALDANSFYMTYGFVAYTTFSHTEEEPRSRALFLLHEPISDARTWQLLTRAVMSIFQPECDLASADLSRAFLGNPDATMRIDGKFLPPDVVAMLVEEQGRLEAAELLARQRSIDIASYAIREGAITNEGSMRIFERWLSELRATPEGDRSRALNRFAYLAGKHIVAKGVLPVSAVHEALLAAALSCGLTRQEASATIRQAVQKGAR